MKVCINCGERLLDKRGRPLDQVYDKEMSDKSGIIRLVECRICGTVADKYIEYEGCVLLLDLALQHLPAFRHTLLNQIRQTLVLKMVLLTLIVDGYVRWYFSAGGGVFFEREAEFYELTGLAVISLATFLLTSILIVAANTLWSQRNLANYGRLLMGLLFAYCVRFLKLVALLWGGTSAPVHREAAVHLTSPLLGMIESTEFLWYFVDILYLLTSINVLKVLTNLGPAQSTLTATVAHLSLHLVEQYTNNRGGQAFQF